jgi:hypothetical protein
MDQWNLKMDEQTIKHLIQDGPPEFHAIISHKSNVDPTDLQSNKIDIAFQLSKMEVFITKCFISCYDPIGTALVNEGDFLYKAKLDLDMRFHDPYWNDITKIVKMTEDFVPHFTINGVDRYDIIIERIWATDRLGGTYEGV